MADEAFNKYLQPIGMYPYTPVTSNSPGNPLVFTQPNTSSKQYPDWSGVEKYENFDAYSKDNPRLGPWPEGMAGGLLNEATGVPFRHTSVFEPPYSHVPENMRNQFDDQGNFVPREPEEIKPNLINLILHSMWQNKGKNYPGTLPNADRRQPY